MKLTVRMVFMSHETISNSYLYLSNFLAFVCLLIKNKTIWLNYLILLYLIVLAFVLQIMSHSCIFPKELEQTSFDGIKLPQTTLS